MSESPSQVTGEPGRPRRAEVLSEAKKNEPGRPRRAEVLSEAKKNEPGRPRRAEVLSEAKKNEPGRPRRAEVLSEAKKNEPGRPRRAEVLSEAKDKISSSQRDEAQRAQDQISPDLIRSDLTLTPSGKSDTACSNHILSFGEDQTEEDEGQKSEEQKEHQQEDTSSSSDNGIVPCHICAYEVTNEQYAVECDSCCEWYHALCLEQNHNLPYNKVLPCENVYVAHSDKLFQLLDSKQVFNEGFPFVCKTCNVDNLPLPVSLYNKHFFNTKQMIQIDSWPSEFDLNEYLTVYNQRVENEIKDGERSVMEGKVEGVPGSTQKEPVGGQGGSTQKEPVTIGSSHVYIPQNCDASPSSNLFHDHLRGLSDDGIQAELLRTTPFEWREENVLARERLAKVESMKSRRENAGIKAPVPLNRGEEIGRIDVTEGRSPLNPHVVEFPPGDALPNEASSAGYSKGLKVDRKGVEAPQVQAKPPPEKSNQRVTIQQATGTESTQVNQNTQSVSKDSSASLIQIFMQQINEQQRAQAEREERMRKEEREVQLEREQRMYEQMSLFMQNNNNHNNTVPTKKKSLVKMPTLEIPEFHGNWTKWPEFWQLWYDVYHTEEQLTPVQKFRYLLRYVKGEAHKVIEHIPIVNENYQVVIDMLKEKYDNPEKIADIHVTSLQALPSILRINTKELRTFYENMEKHLRNLQHGEPNFELKYGYLIKLLMAKLPIIIQDKMLTQHGDQIKKSINKFREALCQILKTQDKLEFDPKPKPERRPNLQSVEVRGKENREMQELQRQMQQLLQIQQTQQAPQVTQLANPRMNPTMNPGYVRRPKECRFCKTPHATTWCSKVTSLAERRKILEDRKICTNCLGFHKSKCSFARTQCFICKETHVAALCPNHDFTKPPPDSLRRTYQPYNTPNNQNARRPGAVVSGQMQYMNFPLSVEKLIKAPGVERLGNDIYKLPEQKAYTMMQIVKVVVQSTKSPYKEHEVYGIIDSGSHKTSITWDLAQKIGIELLEEQSENIDIFTTNSVRTEKAYSVEFEIHSKGKTFVPWKALNVQGQSIERIYQEFTVPGFLLSPGQEQQRFESMSQSGLLADPDCSKFRKIHLDLVIGADYQPEVATTGSIYLERSNILLLATPFGYVTSGRALEISLKTLKLDIPSKRDKDSLEYLKATLEQPVTYTVKPVNLPTPTVPVVLRRADPLAIKERMIDHGLNQSTKVVKSNQAQQQTEKKIKSQKLLIMTHEEAIERPLYYRPKIGAVLTESFPKQVAKECAPGEGCPNHPDVPWERLLPLPVIYYARNRQYDGKRKEFSLVPKRFKTLPSQRFSISSNHPYSEVTKRIIHGLTRPTEKETVKTQLEKKGFQLLSDTLESMTVTDIFPSHLFYDFERLLRVVEYAEVFIADIFARQTKRKTGRSGDRRRLEGSDLSQSKNFPQGPSRFPLPYEKRITYFSFFHENRMVQSLKPGYDFRVNLGFRKLTKCTQSEYYDDILQGIASEQHRELSKVFHLILNKHNFITCQITTPTIRYPQGLFLLPYNSQLAKAYMKYIHVKHGHPSAKGTLAHSRRSVWIPKGSKLAYKTIRGCYKCNNKTLRKIIPKKKVKPDLLVKQPFTKVFVEYIPNVIAQPPGSLTEDGPGGVIWFTCMDTGTVVFNWNVGSRYQADNGVYQKVSNVKGRVQAFQRFIKEYGLPKRIVENHSQTINEEETSERLQVRQIVYDKYKIQNLRIPFSSYWRSSAELSTPDRCFWEGFSEGVKGRFYMWSRGFTNVSLQLFMSQVEQILNSRPIAVVPGEEDKYFTPRAIAAGDPAENRVIKKRAYKFWHSWTSRYLRLLREHSRVHDIPHTPDSIINQVMVWINVNAHRPYLKWTLVKVVKAVTGKNNVIKQMIVSIPSDSFAETTLLRLPASSLCHLEHSCLLSQNLKQEKTNTRSNQNTNYSSVSTPTTQQSYFSRVMASLGIGPRLEETDALSSL